MRTPLNGPAEMIAKLILENQQLEAAIDQMININAPECESQIANNNETIAALETLAKWDV